MSVIEKLGLSMMHVLPPERAHSLSLHALNMGLVPLAGRVTSARLRCTIAGLDLSNPVGLAAGFDKNAAALRPLARAGFGFLEAGAATPLPQPGNPKPRLFRLRAERGAINRFGFNNDGMQAIAQRLARGPFDIPVGLNLGANKTSPDRAADYAHVLAACGAHIDFATVNVSSPNTERLRDLQGQAALTALLVRVMDVRADLKRPVPIFLKIAPDLTNDELASIADVAQKSGVDAIIATNTTLARDGLSSAHRNESGGLSGVPLFEKSTRVLAQLSHLTNGDMPLIGVGGIASAQDAYAKIQAGAMAVQLYTALAYQGISLAASIARELDTLLEADGFASVRDACGTRRGAWL